VKFISRVEEHLPKELIAGNGIWSYALGQVEIVRCDNREVVLTGKLVHGMPCVVLDDLLWRLPYYLVPARSRHKDWEDIVWTGYFVGYSEDKSSWTIYCQNKKGGDVGACYYLTRVFPDVVRSTVQTSTD
jgi:hypothetical protein